jgi:twinkle protein
MSAAAQFVAHNRVTDADVRKYLDADVSGSIKSALEFHVEVQRALNGLTTQGDVLPWPKTHRNFRLRPGEVTLWHGINGHGKSAVTGQVALFLATQGKKSCIGSFEMLPRYTLERMVTQCAGSADPSERFVADFFLAFAQTLWIYDRRGRVDPKYLFAAIRYCAVEKGITHFFIDSLMKCVSREDDYGAQSDFINGLCDVAHETETHIHLVHHVRKGDDENKKPGKFDARGAGAITDQVDNVIAVWRNKAKEREREESLRVGAVFKDESPDFLLLCDKQRNGKWEGIWGLWGDPQSRHFREVEQVGWTRGYSLPTEVLEPGALG